MTAETRQILEAALSLSEAERAELAVLLMDSIGDGSSRDEIDAAWLTEAKRRLEAARSGRTEVFPTEDVELELDELVEAPMASRRAG